MWKGTEGVSWVFWLIEYEVKEDMGLLTWRRYSSWVTDKGRSSWVYKFGCIGSKMIG
jgi:hypothetical protein